MIQDWALLEFGRADVNTPAPEHIIQDTLCCTEKPNAPMPASCVHGDHART